MKESRRTFIRRSSLSLAGFALGTEIVFANTLGNHSILALDEEIDFYTLFEKDKGMTILNDRPWNAETPAHILNDAVTPASKMFVRNNGKVPERLDAANWKLVIDGEAVESPKSYRLSDLKKFKEYTYQLTLECGGNGRSEFNPPAKGNQWTVGAVSCATWTGIRLKDLLQDVGVLKNAVYVAYYGADKHLNGDPDKVVISRGIPMSKALQDETLLAYKLNGEDIPLVHGYPLRLVAGGWPASASGKWVNRLSIRNMVHDGPKMKGQSYRVPCEPVPPGAIVEDSDMCIIESMPVKSLITYPKSGAIINEGRKLSIRGHAWSGEQEVETMEYSIDFGSTWSSCILNRPKNRLAWQQWSAEVSFPKKGYYEVWARAINSKGEKQPMVLPNWNPKGYLNNACHRIAIKVV